MPYYTEDTARRSQFELSQLPATFSEVLGAQFESTLTELPLVAGKRATELAVAEYTGPRVDQTSALERVKSAGLEGHLAIDASGTTDAALQILIERKREELRRNEILSNAGGGLARNAARFGVALGTSVIDPLNVALSFVPVVGQARYARMLYRAGSALGRAGVRATVGAAEGAVGAALIEPLIYSAKQYEQADYDMTDSLLNVAFGTVLGGGLHVVGGASLDAWRARKGDSVTADATVRRALDAAAEERARPITPATIEAGGTRLDEDLDGALELGTARVDGEAARTVAQASPQTREAALRTAEGQAMSGLRIDVEPLFAGERGRLSDGTDTAALVPERFDAEAQRPAAAALANDANRRIAVIEADAARAGAGGKPRYTPRLLRELGAARAHLDAAVALVEGRTLTPAHVEGVRQGTIARALNEGVSVPAQALGGLPDSLREQADALRGQRQAAAARQATDAPDPNAARQIEETAAVDEEVGALDDTLEAAEEEAKLAEQLLTEQAERFGDEAVDETIAAAAELAERFTTWSRVAELAQVCVLRGG